MDRIVILAPARSGDRVEVELVDATHIRVEVYDGRGRLWAAFPVDCDERKEVRRLWSAAEQAGTNFYAAWRGFERLQVALGRPDHCEPGAFQAGGTCWWCGNRRRPY